MLMVVLFPAPFGPRNEKISPFRTVKLMPRTAQNPLNACSRSRTSMISSPPIGHRPVPPALVHPHVRCSHISLSLPFSGAPPGEPRGPRPALPAASLHGKTAPAAAHGPARIGMLKYQNSPIPPERRMCGYCLLIPAGDTRPRSRRSTAPGAGAQEFGERAGERR